MFRLRSHAAGGPRRHLLLGTASVVLLLASVAPAQAAPSVYVTNGDHVSVSQYGIGAGGLLAPLVPPTASAQDFPLGVAVSPNGKSVYVANEGRYDSVSQFNVAAGGQLLHKSPATVPAGVGPTGVAVSPGGGSVYVTSTLRISQYNVDSHGKLTPKNPAMIPAPNNAGLVAVSPGGGSVYVTSRRRQRLSIHRRPGREALPEEPGNGGRRPTCNRGGGTP